MMVAVEEEAEPDLCLVEVGKEDLMTYEELVERGVVEGLVLMAIVLLEAVVLEPMVKMVLGIFQAWEVIPMVIHKLSH